MSDASPDREAIPALNLKQVAARLGVHYMTVYRYVRQGRLEAERSGTEWRVSIEALEGFSHVRGVSVPASALPRREAPGSEPATSEGLDDVDWSARLERCLLAGDEVAAWRVVESALAAAHPPQFCYVSMLASALTSIGERWDAGELDVADQYVATAVASRIVARLGARFRRPGRSRGVVVFGAPLGELHSLPIALAADLVRLAGFDVLELGANVPPEAFATAAARSPRLVAVGVGITATERVAAAQAAVDAVRAVDPSVPIVLGGQAAWDPAAVAMTGVTAWALDGSEVAATITGLVPGAPRHGARPISSGTSPKG